MDTDCAAERVRDFVNKTVSMHLSGLAPRHVETPEAVPHLCLTGLPATLLQVHAFPPEACVPSQLRLAS